jgi:transposase InsO family protein
VSMLEQFPFRILGFHSDNGGEFINGTVQKLLNKLLIAQTKSRPRHSNDNALVECKSGAVIRKYLGYGYIAGEHAQVLQEFYLEYFNPYLNFHRPCGVPESVVNAKGKEQKQYRWYATPWEILRPLPGVTSALQAGLTIQEMDNRARRQTDLQAAVAMQAAKQRLFATFPDRRTA